MEDVAKPLELSHKTLIRGFTVSKRSEREVKVEDAGEDQKKKKRRPRKEPNAMDEMAAYAYSQNLSSKSATPLAVWIFAGVIRLVGESVVAARTRIGVRKNQSCKMTELDVENAKKKLKLPRNLGLAFAKQSHGYRGKHEADERRDQDMKGVREEEEKKEEEEAVSASSSKKDKKRRKREAEASESESESTKKHKKSKK